MVVHVAERAKASGAAAVVVATDDVRIKRAVELHGFATLMTRTDHASGTDRLAEAATELGLTDDSIVVNVQGDEPLIEPGLISGVAQQLQHYREAALATACHPLRSAEEFFSTNVVKVVFDRTGYALYFSRAPIPYARDDFVHSHAKLPVRLPAYRHIGIYAYRMSFLRCYAQLPPVDIERFEALEQLRALAHGFKISVLVTAIPAPGVDTEEDLHKVRALFDQR